jgi:beta-galactosidase beta subunit
MTDILFENVFKGIVLERSSDSILIEDIDTKEKITLNADKFIIELLKESSEEVMILTYDPIKKIVI